MAEQLTLLLRVAFVVLLYVFIWRVLRVSVRDVRAPQESMVMSAAAAAAARPGGPSRPAAAPQPAPAGAAPRLVVLESPTFPVGTMILIDDAVVLGRAPDADAVLESDGFASGHHARIAAEGSRVVVEDLGSTNGTWVNGQRIAGSRIAGVGDEVVVGSTRMRIEAR